MKKKHLKITIILIVSVVIIFLVLNFVFFQGKASKSRASGETMELHFDKESIVTAVNTDFTVTVRVRPSITSVLQGYKTIIRYDPSYIKFKSIDYMVGNVSPTLGDTTDEADDANGNITVIGEINTTTGYTMISSISVDLATLTFTTLSTNSTIITINDPDFYSINSDASLSNNWSYNSNIPLRIN